MKKGFKFDPLRARLKIRGRFGHCEKCLLGSVATQPRSIPTIVGEQTLESLNLAAIDISLGSKFGQPLSTADGFAPGSLGFLITSPTSYPTNQ
jgi:hypothetical protein